MCFHSMRIYITGVGAACAAADNLPSFMTSIATTGVSAETGEDLTTGRYGYATQYAGSGVYGEGIDAGSKIVQSCYPTYARNIGF